MTEETIKQKALTWLFDKPLPIVILMILNIVMAYTISQLWEKVDAVQNQMYTLQNTIIQDNTKAFIEFNLKNKDK
jgi:hypothetical protein